MQVNIHIGQPKSYSTFYQRYLSDLETESQCIYLGFRPTNDVTQWYKSLTEHQIIEQALRYDSHKCFRNNKAHFQKFIHDKIKESEASSLPLWLSAENLAMQILPGEIDVEDKLSRLQSVFPHNVELHFHCVFRNIHQAIYSLYKQLVNMGYGQSFGYFVEETRRTKASCYLDGLIPSQLAEQIAQVKGANCQVHFYFTDNLPCSLNGLDLLHTEGILNRSQSVGCYQELANYNRSQGIGETLSSMSEIHRRYWSKNITPDDEVWHKRRIIKENIERCQRTTEQDMEIDQVLASYISDFSHKEATRLAQYDSWLTQYGSLSHLFKIT